MATFRGNVYVGQRVQIDGHEFDGNSFKNCVLVYGGGLLNFKNNQLENVKWEFVDAAARTVTLLASFYQGGGSGRKFVELVLSTSGKPVETSGKPVGSAS